MPEEGHFFDKNVQEWKSVEEVELSTTPESDHLAQLERAKLIELANWKSFNVYEEIPNENEGQSTMSTRWVLTEKNERWTEDYKGKACCKRV